MEEPRAQPNIVRLGVLLGGGTLLLLGFCCGAIYVLLPLFSSGADILESRVSMASVAAMALLFGGALTYQGIRALRRSPSERFLPPPARLLVLAFVLSLVVGQLILFLSPNPQLTSLIFPPFHIMASALPALAILAFVGRRMTAHRSTWRTIYLEVSHGAILSLFLAFCIEIAALVVILGLALVAFLLFTPDGTIRMTELVNHLRDPAWSSNPTNLANLLLSPPAIIIVGILLVVVTPLLEELLKSLGIPILRNRLQHKSDALLWGVACGTGFSLAEGLLNGSTALDGWCLVMLARWGSTLMHCLASGLMGLGWYRLLSERRFSPLLLSYGASVGIHALWNSVTLGVAGSSLLAAVSPQDPGALVVAGLGMLFFVALMFALTILIGLALVQLTKKADS